MTHQRELDVLRERCRYGWVHVDFLSTGVPIPHE